MMEKLPWTGQVYLCGECGTIYNNRGLACPTCELKAKLHETTEFLAGLASASVDEEPPKEEPDIPDVGGSENN
jgi:hypothetical protein